MSQALRTRLVTFIAGLSLVARVATAGLSELPQLVFSDPLAHWGLAGGDVNGDGVSDLVAATDNEVQVFLGSPTGLSTTPDWVIDVSGQGGYPSLAVGDVNGDEIADIAAGLWRYGSGGAQSGGAGAVFVWLGGSDMATRVDGSFVSSDWYADAGLITSNDLAWFGLSVALVDLDNDRVKDVVVGSAGWSSTNPTTGPPGDGAVFVWMGSTALGDTEVLGIPVTPASGTYAQDWSAYGTPNSPIGTRMRFGISVGGSDVNGDGFADLLVGANTYAGGQVDEGAMLAFFGQSNFPTRVTGSINNANRVVEGGIAGALLGLWVGGAGDVNGDGYGDVIAVASGDIFPPPPETSRFLLLAGGSASLTPIWTKTSVSYQRFISGTPGDVNGDGLGDVLLGRSVSGSLEIYFGRHGVGPDITPSETRFAQASRCAAIGDANGDGFGDVATVTLTGSQNLLHAWYGGGYVTANQVGASSFGSQPSAGYGFSVSTGDWNGDGFTDYVSGEPGFDGGETDEGRIVPVLGGPCKPACPPAGFLPAGAWESNQPAAQLGSSVAGVGDVNGDGFDDVVAGAPLFDGVLFGPGGFEPVPDAGAIFLHVGGATGLGTSIAAAFGGFPTTLPAGSQLGFSVSAAGDVNGDGLGDVLVGAPYAPNGSIAGAGKVELYLGDRVNLLYPAWSVSGTAAGEHLGVHVAPAGDVNGDGYSDVLITGVNYGVTAVSAARLYLGRKGGLAPTPSLTVLTDSPTGDFGVNVAAAGDVNDDGFSDFAVGEPEWNGNRGRVRIFHGASGAAIGPAAVTLTGPSVGGRFGYGVSGGGDVNADGYSDLLVGEQWFSNPTFAEGRAQVFLGGAAGVSPTQVRQLADTPGDSSDYGRDVALNADFNGDGFADAIVGAFKADHVASDVGGVFVHFGGGGPGAPRAVATRHLAPAGPLALRGITSPGESPGFAAGATLSSAYGRARMKLEVEVKPLGFPFDGGGLASSTTLLSALGGTPHQASAVCISPIGCHWRLRMRSTEPAFPATPWFSPAGNSRREADLRVFSDPDGDGVTASADLCASVANPDQSNVDADLFGNVCDNCETIANDDQADGDADAVGNVCDNCTARANPRVASTFLTTNPWATLTGGQRDDDQDGYGNRCDAKFTPGALVGSSDLAQFRASNGKNRTLDVCGTTGTRPCAIFDLDEAGLLIGSADYTQFRLLNGKAPGPKCGTCPLPCQAGANGSCSP